MKKILALLSALILFVTFSFAKSNDNKWQSGFGNVMGINTTSNGGSLNGQPTVLLHKLNSQVNNIIADSSGLQLVSSNSLDSVYTIQILRDTVSLRFHFKVIKSSITEYQSGNLSSDFTISNGFVSIFDTQKVAIILIEKLKSGNTELRINKVDLELNGIPIQ